MIKLVEIIKDSGGYNLREIYVNPKHVVFSFHLEHFDKTGTPILSIYYNVHPFNILLPSFSLDST